MRRAVWRCLRGAVRSLVNMASIANLNGPSFGAIRCGVLRGGGHADDSAWRTVRRCT